MNIINTNTYPPCPKCGGTPINIYSYSQFFTTYICNQKCGYIYWTLKFCPTCNQPQKTLILKKPNFGQKITCKNCNKSCFYLLCPRVECKKQFYKTENHYRMGSVLSCNVCHLEYKSIVCPCGGEIFLDKNIIIYQGFSTFECQCCRKTLIFTNCPNCKQTEYHHQKLQIGNMIRCSHCKMQRKYVPCPYCGVTLKGQQFSFHEPLHCNHCNIHFQFCKCPFGCQGQSYNRVTQQMGPQRTCQNCKKPYFVINCKQCKISLYPQAMNVFKGIIDSCPQCKKKMEYYMCPCGIFNKELKCKNKQCHQPLRVTDNIKLKQKQNRSNEVSSVVNEVKECKICFNGIPEYINEECGHILMCLDCMHNYYNEKKTEKMPCPVCKTVGRYFKYIDPIYS